jgi:urease accessory protein
VIDAIALQKLLAWLAPSFPTGAFAWSAGMETAIAQRLVTDRASTEDWILGLLAHGTMRADAILLAHAHRAHAEQEALANLADLGIALIPSAERLDESVQTGRAFRKSTAAWPAPSTPPVPDPCPYPVVIGALAGVHELPLDATLLAFLLSAVQAQISVAVRLVPIGQTAGLSILAALEPEIAREAALAASAELAAIGGMAYAADIAQMRHETLPVRIFRS